MKSLSLLLIGLFPTWLLAQTTSHNVLFPSGVHALDASTRSAAEAFIQSAAVPYPCLKVILRGHADADGDEAANIALSQRRVEAVKAQLLKWGVPAANVRVDAKGESAPVADNASEQGKAQNRRVEIKLAKTSGECNPLSKGVPMENIRFAAEKGLEYTYARSGTKLRIPAHALVDANGRAVKGEVRLHYREWRDAADFVYSGIPMQFPDNGSSTLFHSGGMYEVRAEQNGKPLALASGKSVEVDFALTSTERFDRFVFANGAWTQLGAPIQVMGAANAGLGGGGAEKTKPKCNEGLAEIGKDTLAEFRKALHKGLRLALTEKQKGKGALAVTPRRAWESKEYMGKNWVGAKPDANIVKQAHCLSLTTKPLKWGQRINLADASGTFSELRKLDNVMMILRADDYAKLRAQFEGKKFCDVRVRQYTGGAGSVSLKHEKGYIELPVLLKGAPKKGVNTAKFPPKRLRENVKDALRMYEQALNERFKAVSPEQVDFLLQTFSRPLMTGDELCMNLAEWTSYFNAKKDSMQARYTAAIERYDLDDAAARKCIGTYLAERKTRLDNGTSTEQIAFDRGMAWRGESKGGPAGVPAWTWNAPGISTNAQAMQGMLWNQGFGVFNCDQLQQLPSPVVVSPTFRSDSGAVKPCNTYSLYKQLNGMMQGDVGHQSNENIYLSKTWTTRAVLVLGFDGKLYLADSEDVVASATVSSKGRPSIHLEDITASADTAEKLRELLKKLAA